MTTAFYNGKRLSFDGALCTVRFFGTLPGTKGDWLGVEWDLTDRGKHDGTYREQRIFYCLSRSATAASFIRPSRKADPTRTVLEALKHKYGSKPVVNGKVSSGVNKDFDVVRISGKAVEEVGFDKIQDQIGHFESLKVVLLDGMQVAGLTRDLSPKAAEKASHEFAETCPMIEELDLGWNLFENWHGVLEICRHLPRLRILRASGLRLKSFSTALPGSNGTFHCLEELHLNETLLSPDQLLACLVKENTPVFPALKTLSVSLNEWPAFRHTPTSLAMSTVDTINIEANEFTNLDSLPSLFTAFPSLTNLSLSFNAIKDLHIKAPGTFPRVTSISLTSNLIPTFPALEPLRTVFPNLTSLRITKNPLYDTLSPTAPADAAYYLILARLPNLKILNHTTITPRDRDEGEIYYLSVAEKDIRSILTKKGLSFAQTYVSDSHPLYAQLCTKHDRTNILLLPPEYTVVTGTPYPSGSLASRVVQCTFYIPSRLATQDQPNWQKSLPKTLSVYKLKSLVHRHFGLAPLQFTLTYESPELDPIPETTRKTHESKEDWERWGDFDVDVPPLGTTQVESHDAKEGKWIDGILYREGARWRRRETEIIDGLRSWGDFLDGGEKEVTIRVEPRMMDWEEHVKEWRREELN